MATKPGDNKPGWVATTVGKIEPSGSKKTNGFAPLEPLGARAFNWLLYSISVWIAYFEAVTDELVAVPVGTAIYPITLDETYEITEDDNGKIFFIDSEGGQTLNGSEDTSLIYQSDNDYFPPGDLPSAPGPIFDLGGGNFFFQYPGLWIILPDVRDYPGTPEGGDIAGVELPVGFRFTLHDKTGQLGNFPITLMPGKRDYMTSQLSRIDGTGGFYSSPLTAWVLDVPFGTWTLMWDGDEWHIS